MSSSQEHEIASELLEVTHAGEIDRFLPLLIGPALMGLKALAPMVMKAAVPLLKKVAVKAIPKIKTMIVKAPSGGGSSPQAAACPQGEGELGWGFGGGVSTRSARRWGTQFQRVRPRQVQYSMSRRFVRAARAGARRAGVEIARMLRRRPGPIRPSVLRRVVYRSLLRAVRVHAPFLLPTMGAVAASLRRVPAYFGPALPRPRPGRLFGAPQPRVRRAKPAYFGPPLPTVRSRVLGSPPRAPAGPMGAPRRPPVTRPVGARAPMPRPIPRRPPVVRPVVRQAPVVVGPPRMRARPAGAARTSPAGAARGVRTRAQREFEFEL